jgi:enoyl-CoA hydratase
MDMTETTEPMEENNIVTYEVVGGVAWVSMNRPKYNNAQNGQMTYELDAAFMKAVANDDVKVIVLRGQGKHFSAGHDIGTPGRDVHLSQ